MKKSITLSEEKLNSNYVLFIQRLNSNGINSDKLIDLIGEDKIKRAPGYTLESSGIAYDGGLIEFMVRKVAKYAVYINNLLPEEKRVGQDSIIKVAFLHQIAKSILYIKNDDDYQVKKYGVNYVYADQTNQLKVGELSVKLCHDADIKFTDDEYEAMLILDKMSEFNVAYPYVKTSTLSNLIVVATTMANNEIN